MKKSEKNENLNKFLKAIVVVLLTILVITVIYNMIFEINKEISNTDFNISDAQKNTVTTNNIEDWNLILVNRWNKIPENYTIDLIEVPGGEKVDKRIYEPLMKMLEDAKEENWGKEPLIVSGYRTNENQKELYDDKIKSYKNKGYSKEKAKEEAEKWVSVPGYSEHQLGLAVDINGATYDLYFWLQENSHKYGFIYRYPAGKTEITGINEEVWHYRYVGVEVATEIYKQNLCLEEYLQMNNK
jgi:D-alanyl-D-alanine carboxypeptidase